jgi:hypothetical protein
MFEKLIFGKKVVKYYEFIEIEQANQILDLKNWQDIRKL